MHRNLPIAARNGKPPAVCRPQMDVARRIPPRVPRRSGCASDVGRRQPAGSGLSTCWTVAGPGWPSAVSTRRRALRTIDGDEGAVGVPGALRQHIGREPVVRAEGDGHLLDVELSTFNISSTSWSAVKCSRRPATAASSRSPGRVISASANATATRCGSDNPWAHGSSACSTASMSSSLCRATARRTDSQVWHSWCLAARTRTTSVVTASTPSRAMTSACHRAIGRPRSSCIFEPAGRRGALTTPGPEEVG